MKKIIVIALIVLSTFSGCATSSSLDIPKMREKINKTMDSWLWTHYSKMMLKWGPPTYSADDGNGGQILVYQYNRNGGQIPGSATKIFGTVYYTAPKNINYTAERMFYVNAEGIIYSWKWKGM